MVKGLKFAVAAAILLGPFAYPHSASARTFQSYQEAIWMCGTGDLEACDAMHAYEQSAVFKQEIQPKLQPFFVGEYTTYRCDVKYEQ